MIELSVDNLHLTYGDNPVLKGVSMQLKRGGGSFTTRAVRQWQNHLAARGGRIGKTYPGENRHWQQYRL
ncbi:Uncharacterised protein [Serratia fonticola]|uniref:Uncharacterized protein n=1 Tax=Serratia fonticola TaxID=47917 RepID=A0A4U9UBP0_SERFO|nr:Uncharacterised protein [Serratia fonticola]